MAFKVVLSHPKKMEIDRLSISDALHATSNPERCLNRMDRVEGNHSISGLASSRRKDSAKQSMLQNH
jgi:hypothetical protein